MFCSIMSRQLVEARMRRGAVAVSGVAARGAGCITSVERKRPCSMAHTRSDDRS